MKDKDADITVEYIKLNEREVLAVTHRPGEAPIETLIYVVPPESTSSKTPTKKSK